MDHLERVGNLYILSYYAYSRNSYNFCLQDQAINYASNPKQFIKSKNSCILTREIERLLDKLGCQFNPQIPCSLLSKEVILRDQQKASLLEMSFIPTTMNEFKNSKHYTLTSILKKYQGLSPNAQPVIEGSTTNLE